ncbi:Interferon-induced GTP-binding protein [Penicillium digitatum]|uniref:Interferon-induced GTP-binding protein n=1 Tax=Penicillium digitatum TaxID=36651 RepID=A0A7T7BQ86_PENDI|nr:Interferon-induced GTP-binding protein [Penicillium digitatum]
MFVPTLPVPNDGFGQDVLRVEVSGPDQPDLTLIDVPRLYFTEDITDENREPSLGRRWIEKYLLHARSIILTVVSAKIDFCAQKITGIADKYDRARTRILGTVNL